MSNLPTSVQKHGNLAQALFTFEVPGETLVALYNALSFVVENEDDYIMKIHPCKECLPALKTFRLYLESITKKASLFAKEPPLSN
jgi:hypothetical protein